MESNEESAHIQRALHEQAKKLIHIDESRERMDGTLKRVKKHLAYFRRNYLSDKLIIGLIIILVLAILAILIYSALDTDGSNTQSDSVHVLSNFRSETTLY